MEWSADSIVLSVRHHGETSAIVSLMTGARGRHLGLVRGGAGRKLRGVLQAGNEVRATWRGRLDEHLGTYSIELIRSRAAMVLDDANRLAALSALCAITDTALAEREPHTAIYHGLEAALAAIEESPVWPAVFVRYELGLLQELGFGLNLVRCVATGSTDDLIYVSPKSAGAVCREAGEPYKDKLLPLPAFLLGSQAGEVSVGDIRNGLRLTGYFLERDVFAHSRHHEPAARTRLVERISRASTISGDIFGA
jgi:DNA repair protein RecO (recombination protein O)